MSTVVERVAAGLKWLLDNRAVETVDIDRDSLNVADAHKCPLGQTGGYWDTLNTIIPKSDDMDNSEWLDAHEAQTQWAIAHGFQISTDDMEFASGEYMALNDEWRRVLAG
jgi:hypothetical protein